MTFIHFDESIYDDAVSGVRVAKYCNKKFKPSNIDHSFDSIVEENDIWFIKRDFLPEFFSALRTNQFPNITVVTQHSDYEVNDILMQSKPVCVRRVFGPNNTSKRQDSIPIPLGLGPPFGHGAPLAEDIKNADTNRVRNKLLYVNFRPHTYLAERLPLMNQFVEAQYDWTTIGNADPTCQKFDQYLHELTSHKFCLCPRGNGIDTHRLWESLYCRTVPVVKYCDAHRNFTDLPILFVDDWSVVTEKFLNNKYEEMSCKQWDYSKLTASWWAKQFSMEK